MVSVCAFVYVCVYVLSTVVVYGNSVRSTQLRLQGSGAVLTLQEGGAVL